MENFMIPKPKTTINLYPINNYSFGTKDTQVEKDKNVIEKMKRMKENFSTEGTRKSVEGVLLVHVHQHPHVLLLKIGENFYKLPGGKVTSTEGEIFSLKKKLDNKLTSNQSIDKPEWEVGDLAAVWWRSNFENSFVNFSLCCLFFFYLSFSSKYPYIPPHVSKPKEMRQIFVVGLPEKCYFAVPKNFKLIAVPLYDLYSNARRFGPIIASIPQALSRYNFVYR